MGECLLLFALGSLGCLGRLSLGHTLLKLIYAPGSIDELLLTGANTNDYHGLGGTGLDHIAAGATDFAFHVLRMNVCFHKRPDKIPSDRPMTRTKIVAFESNFHLQHKR
jgi:hypothetical protein